MIKALSVTTIVLLSIVPARAEGPAGVAVTVEGVANATGRVLVAVCTRETFLGADCPHLAYAPAPAGGKVEIVLEGIKPGTYAVQAFHDENENFEIDRSFLGMPIEGIGFSNDAPMNFGPPEFDKAKIELKHGRNETRFRMRYY